MECRSIGEFAQTFLARGQECAYVQPRGLRSMRWSYRDVAETSFRFARELNARQIKKGDRILIWGPNSAEWVSVFYGCALAGVISVPIDEVSPATFAAKVYESVNAKLLFCPREHKGLEKAATIYAEELREAVSPHSADLYPVKDVGREDILEIVFTSGTTAEPKGVVITHGNVLANVVPLEREILKYLKYERLVHPVRFLNLLPLSHVFGQFLGIFLPQLMGGTVVFHNGLKPADIITTIRRERVSVLVAVPRILQAMKEKVERTPDNEVSVFEKRFRHAKGKHFLRRWWIFRHIRRQFGWKFWAFICGGATLDSDTEEFWDRLGYAIIQGYGLTETTSLVSVKHPFRPGKLSIGKVLEGREVKLASGGEVLVRGGSISTNYWSEGEMRPAISDDSWFHTGDIGEFDVGGNLHFKGRVKDVIVTSAGMNIYPEDLEKTLRCHPEVKDCVVVGVPQGGNAEPCAVLLLRGRDDNGAQIMERANRELAEYQRLRLWYVWPHEDFPRTATQKPRKNIILQEVLAGQSKSETKLLSHPLAELVSRITGKPSISASSDSALESHLGLSSLDRIALIGAIEDRYQVDLRGIDLAAIDTLRDLERVLDSHQKGSSVNYHFATWTLRWPVTWLRKMAQHALLRPAIWLLARPQVDGREKLNGVKGPVLVICNHVSDVDFAFVVAVLPSSLRSRIAIATAGEELEALRTPTSRSGFWHRIYSRMKWTLAVSLLNLFPLPRRAGFRDSFAFAGECVDRGYSLLIFPEGGHTLDGKLKPFRVGIGVLANELAISIVPVRIDGLFEAKRAGRRFVAPGQISVKVGDPVIFTNRENPEKIAEDLQRIVNSL